MTGGTTWKLIAGALAIAVVVLLVLVWRGADEREVAEGAREVPRDAGAMVGAPAMVQAPVSPALPERVVPQVHGRAATVAPALDAIDPCTEVREVEAPAGFETVTAGPITLAYPPATEHHPLGQPLAPLSIAHLAAGILEEAAQVTGTTMRPHVVVIVHRSLDELRAVPGAPVWSDGLYDGAVRVPLTDARDLALALDALRHEIMHAQLHATVGCMPMWLNEGLASWFGHETNLTTWLKMLRDHRALDASELVAGAAKLDVDTVHVGYAQSLLMVMYAQEHLGGVDALLRAYATTGDPAQAWQKLFPDADPPALLDWLAHRLLGAAPGASIDSLLSGPICCWGLRDPANVGCRPGTKPGIDRSRSPVAFCFAR